MFEVAIQIVESKYVRYNGFHFRSSSVLSPKKVNFLSVLFRREQSACSVHYLLTSNYTCFPLDMRSILR